MNPTLLIQNSVVPEVNKTTMDSQLFEKLLHMAESECLDFKRDQYPFAGASDAEQSELLKDILAFANSWRTQSAYILIGVEQVHGGRGIVHGISNHLAEHSLQQFVNSRTQRQLLFKYEVFSFDGIQCGVIEIPCQERPIFLKKDFGKLKAKVVYVRRGSSTDMAGADPDEIARMGAEQVSRRNQPCLDLNFAGIANGMIGSPLANQSFGKKVEMKKELIQPLDGNIIQTLQDREEAFARSSGYRLVSDYYRDISLFIYFGHLYAPLGMAIENDGGESAKDVRIQLYFPKSQCEVIHQGHYPKRPIYKWGGPFKGGLLVGGPYIRFESCDVHIRETDDCWVALAHFDKILPGTKVFTDGVFLVTAEKSCEINVLGTIFGENISSPPHFEMTLKLEVGTRSMTIEEFESYKSV